MRAAYDSYLCIAHIWAEREAAGLDRERRHATKFPASPAIREEYLYMRESFFQPFKGVLPVCRWLCSFGFFYSSYIKLRGLVCTYRTGDRIERL